MNGNGIWRIAILLGGGLLAVGCQNVQQKEPHVTLDPTPIQVDEAMQVRDWNQSVAYYPNSKTVAGNTGFYWQPKPGINLYESAAIETPLYIANIFASPISLLITPPWVPVVWDPGTVPPTYTAMPPLESPSSGVQKSGSETPYHAHSQQQAK